MDQNKLALIILNVSLKVQFSPGYVHPKSSQISDKLVKPNGRPICYLGPKSPYLRVF